MNTSDADAGDQKVETPDVETLRRSLEEEQKRNLRLLADFENYRRRVAREQESTGHEGRRAALLELLPVLDTLEEALAAGSTDPAFYEGVAATHRLFINALRKAGAEPIESVGQPFDPKIHEAVATVASDGVEPGIITREVRRGWQLADELLRPAQVEVAISEEDAGQWQ